MKVEKFKEPWTEERLRDFYNDSAREEILTALRQHDRLCEIAELATEFMKDVNLNSVIWTLRTRDFGERLKVAIAALEDQL